MKLQPDRTQSQTITAHGAGWVAIDGEKVHVSIVIGSHGERFDWPCRHFDELSASLFEPIAAIGAELVIFGSGERLRFPKPEWLAALTARQIGVETMDTAAACRSYNVLVGDGRHVVAALLLESKG
ncbi:MAG: Mth938-like domain-containing protein [Variovorax sp.]